VERTTVENDKGLRFRQLMIGGAPLVGGLLVVTALAITPWEGGYDDVEAYYETVGAQPGRAQLATVLLGFGFLFLVPAFAAVLAATRHRARRLGNAAWVLGTLGYGLMAGMTVVIDVYDSVLVQELGVEQAHALGDLMEVLPAVVAVGMLGGLGSLAGVLLAAIALWRSGEVPRWGAAALALGAFGFMAAPNELLPMVAVGTVQAIGWATLSLRLLRARDWDPGGPAAPRVASAAPSASAAASPLGPR
jgi:hypothetical protein